MSRASEPPCELPEQPSSAIPGIAPAAAAGADPEELALMTDPRLREAVELFNSGAWYAAHDLFEELWHESSGSMRPLLQGILQLAVAQLHVERGNRRGATILTGEGLGRLRRCPDQALGLDLCLLRDQASRWLQQLQSEQFGDCLPPPTLMPASGRSPA